MPVGGSQKGGQLLLFGGAGDSKTFWLTDNTSVSDLMGSLQYAFSKENQQTTKGHPKCTLLPFLPSLPDGVVSPATWSQCSRVPQHSGLHVQGKLPWNIRTIDWNVTQTLGKNLPLLKTCFRANFCASSVPNQYCRVLPIGWVTWQNSFASPALVSNRNHEWYIVDNPFNFHVASRVPVAYGVFSTMASTPSATTAVVLPSIQILHFPEQSLVWRLLSIWEGPFSRAMLVSGRACSKPT